MTQTHTEPTTYVSSVADEIDTPEHSCQNCGTEIEWLQLWYALVDEDEGGIVAYFSTLERANKYAKALNAHEQLVEALRALVAEQGGYSDRMPWEQARAALAAATAD